MVAFVIGGLERPLDDYRDASVLEEAYRAVHKSPFALAYHSLLTEETASKEKSEGSVEFVMHGVIGSRVFSAVVEGLLLAICVGCVLLLVLSARTKSNLSADPAALGDQMAMLRNSSDLFSRCFPRYTAPQGRRFRNCKTTPSMRVPEPRRRHNDDYNWPVLTVDTGQR
ncbi:hypothetical protein VUR80DRAFT_10302 [Thermomyces stellatus]